MEDLKNIISKNLIRFRKASKMTQIQLAEKLLYSNKNISKWERGDSVPDVIVLNKLAKIYSVSVNDFLIENDVYKIDEKAYKTKTIKTFSKKHMIITLLSASLVWLVAFLLFGFFYIFTPLKVFAWWSIFFALPVSLIVVFIFTNLWGSNPINAIFLSLLIWSVALALFLCVSVQGIWLVFIVAIPFQVLTLLWYYLKQINLK